jgi:hypothetical protein
MEMKRRAAGKIRSQIRGWSAGDRKKVGMGVVREVSAEESVVAGEVVCGVMRGFKGPGEEKSMEEIGGIKKTVAYDIMYERS